MSLRSRIEHWSVPYAERLNGMPRAVSFVAVLVLVGVSVALDALGWIPLVVLALFMAWMLFLLWPRMAAPDKVLRLAVLLIVLAAAATRAFPR